MATEDLCVACAEPLDWTGFGPCGHKDACSSCVARLRFVLEEKKCMMCKQENLQVFFTRYTGEYTARLGPQQFEALKDRAAAGELYALPEVDGYFDDHQHYQEIKKLCSFSHPALAPPGVAAPSFDKLDTLKRKLRDAHQLQFCDLCLKGRRVFIAEQVLYSKSDLERHMRQGDDSGPLAEAGFKGHPLCRFCRKRFYDNDDLYRHMEGQHEHCFICRRNNPGKFVYFKDYNEMEDHFKKDHHICPHPICLERKFVVFESEELLKRHFATEHADELNMSRSQRRQALAINIDLQYRREAPAGGRGAADDMMSRPGVTIGGGAGLQQQRRGGAMRHSRSDPTMTAAVAASMDSARAEAAARAAAAEPVNLNAEEFPSVSDAAGVMPLGTWVGNAGPGGAVDLAGEDFPALPSMNRNQRRRAREREQRTTLAARLAPAAAPVRVLNRGGAGAAAGGPSGGLRESISAGDLAAAAAAAAAAGAGGAGGTQQLQQPSAAGLDGMSRPGAGRGVPVGVDDFPPLAGTPAAPAHPGWIPVKRGKRVAAAAPSAASSTAAAAAINRGFDAAADFPSLPASAKGVGKTKLGKAAFSRTTNTQQPAAAASAVASRPAVAEAAAVAPGSGGVSEGLRAANKELIERCRAALDEEGFKRFKEDSAAFMKGAMAAGAYHDRMVFLGLLPHVVQVAELCPNPQRRLDLLLAHRDFLTSPGANDVTKLGSSWVPPEAALAAVHAALKRGAWECERCTLVNAPDSRVCEACGLPQPLMVAQTLPEPSSSSGGAGKATGASSSSRPTAAAVAAASSSRQQQPQAKPANRGSPADRPAPAAADAGSWPTLGGRPNSGVPAANQAGPQASGSGAAASSSTTAFPTPAAAAEAIAAAGGAGKKKSKGSKKSLQELLTEGTSNPHNAWSQQQRRQAVVAAPAGVAQTPSLGQWGRGGGSKLAKAIGTANDAWAK